MTNQFLSKITLELNCLSFEYSTVICRKEMHVYLEERCYNIDTDFVAVAF
jgi:hypothetical protein